MAKTTKRGLGRGLNSLIGGSSADAPASPSPVKERIFIDGRVDDESSSSSSQQYDSQETSDEKPRQRKTAKPADDSSQNRDQLTRVFDEVPLESVSPNPDQPRTNFDEDAMKELAASIKKDGLLQPVLVRPIGAGTYQIIAGERRWQACKIAGLKTLPVRIKEADDDKALELALVENVQRTDLNPIEEAYGYKRLMERQKLTQADVAQAMSKGRSTVANALRLLDLPEEAQQLLFEDKISAGHARAILSVPTQKGRQALADKLSKDKLSVRETENLARSLSDKPDAQRTARSSVPPTYKTVEKALHDILKTNVQVRTSRGKNKIEIEFKDEDELKKLFEELLASVS